MTSPLDAIPAPSKYPRTSRYFASDQLEHNGIPHLRPRLLPSPDSFVTIAVYEVRAGDRADVLAFRQFGDAEQWWRIADANPVLDPRELTDTPGRTLRITLPEGVPGTAG
ncbi:LysM domain-containing protein [Amycolatopsis mongoliensis]|uniref:LysM domain-containing protein n=1 Tax=Amycolatopsis mongoliensis TaxID=715475 RepID=A0A9Y2JIN2_9PSEU|nr:LysM domain-containing protein [Amycolatopsis sp. 4-36]WIX99172.1 LysM domain-containing protein [Amycolatopsis sp. 4-36]